MPQPQAAVLSDFNHARYRPGQPQGHYESYFQRANHPTRPLAFWIRYTLFSPHGRPERAVGELWAVWFDGESGHHVAVKEEHAIAQCEFRRDGFGARVGSAVLEDGMLRGSARSGAHRLAWALSWDGAQAPVFLLPPERYASGFPRAKSLVGAPMARFSGSITVDGREHSVADWVGSQNHNWGSRHTDAYAWGQVCGFDDAPDTFLEVASARLRLGPLWTPVFTPLVLRHEGQEWALRSPVQSLLRARGRFHCFDWHFESRAPGLRLEGHVSAPREAFVALRYHNPPGGDKCCLNSKLASCRLTLTTDEGGRRTLESRTGAAFEILADALPEGIGFAA